MQAHVVPSDKSDLSGRGPTGICFDMLARLSLYRRIVPSLQLDRILAYDVLGHKK